MFLKKRRRCTYRGPINCVRNANRDMFWKPRFFFNHVLEQVILALGDFMNVQCHACIGGKSIGEDIRRLDYGVQVG